MTASEILTNMNYTKLYHMCLLGAVAQLTPFVNVSDYHDWHQLLAAEVSALTGLAALFTVPNIKDTPYGP